MNVVGKVGSLISQGVYSVATPFHPFGGAVDVIVVEQQDGTYRSTPWYVRFGKFQGVLKGAEKIVTISVNGVEANFHMYLDNSGQAYFMREVDDQEMSDSKTFVSNQGQDASISGDDCRNSFDENESRIQDEQASPDDGSVGSSSFSSYHYGSLDEVEDLVKQSDSSNSEMVLVSIDGHVLTAPISSNERTMENVQLSTPQFHLGPGEGSGGEFTDSGDVWEPELFGDLDISTERDSYAPRDQSDSIKDCREVADDDEEARSVGKCEVKLEQVRAGLSREETFKSCLDLMSQVENDDSEETTGLSSLSEEQVEETEISTISNLGNDVPQNLESELKDLKHSASVVIRQEDEKPNLHVVVQEADLVKNTETETTRIETESCELLVTSETNDNEILRSTPESSAIKGELNQADSPTLMKQASGLGVEISLCGNLLRPRMGRESAKEVFEAYRISEEELVSSGPTIIKNTNLIVRVEDKYLPWAKIQHVILGKAVFGLNFSAELKDAIPVENDEPADGVSPSVSRRWKLWPIPFRISRSFQHSDSKSPNEDIFLDSESVLQSPTAEQAQSTKSQSPRKQFVRTNIPTNEQIASLNLKEGQNMIAFSFSTRVLGKQQVDAHIYLWKWNARIVISDVDGTITKSDVLGQFMPLVGKDWTQSGVARLFSAIKENGYQLLFLSARAIVQAYLTRSFLLNLKQDGNALPSGPVVISPDGLFPSLYREVIRRAPHEFKIACLQDIKALFPSDYNPFYAGFGNRDTDELSYKKIGIPKGKIFIINPKGEVAINHCVDVKSYTSLHTLVNDMFPPTSLVEQEDYNSWNYWRIPLPDISV
ncbi:phosphatidate phosphatase PAH1 [Ananas comosus]|uniref:phosphatidate phosphatase n=1 Tax=Ananas comosus TaxID=4615 RepID=A0A6P5H1T6_ANACO|nr:phosphatidate phosphatase PAH1 [Ananas comosus]XP_020114000.1 phosphatidate phosphatase PAH1 [Ananas comosus]XP_020114001.1 phosphatidate phosphatase PAH1 [Ananas comosus]XP_020114002.1 phosphatidate phosphatase PAH1 [Ananas comosus]